MNICSEEHDEICYNTIHCPLCVSIKEKEELQKEIEELQDVIEELRERLNDCSDIEKMILKINTDE